MPGAKESISTHSHQSARSLVKFVSPKILREFLD